MLGGASMVEILEKINTAVWGVPLMLLMLGVGVYLSVKTRFVQFRLFLKSLKAFVRQFRKKDNSDGISSYRALCTALAATVGTGNLAGVAGAIAIGGPGAIFWMWICALLGMATKFAEATLAVRYRRREEDGTYIGGPMYMIQSGLKKHWHSLAYVYCFFGVIASFGVGNTTQVNTVVNGLESVVSSFGGTVSFSLKCVIGCILAVILTVMLLGGAKRIGEITELLIPLVSFGYIVLCVTVLFLRAEMIPKAFNSIFVSAFSPSAVTGGVVGSVFVTLRVGISRGVFTNEAGMGTASIAHASGNVKHPTEQGLMGIVEVFIDTILICTLTAFVILCSNVSIPYGTDTGMSLTADAFSAVCGEWVRIPLTLSLCLLAIATILGWGLYGARCAEFLFGKGTWKYFAVLQGLAVIVGAVVKTGTVWLAADIVNGLMAIPNLIALYILTPELARLTKEST